MPTLVDAAGNPISTALLKNQVAAPTPWGVRSITSGSDLSGIDPRQMASLLRGAESGDARRYLELAEVMEEKYMHYASQLATRKRAVDGLDIHVEPASEKLKDRKIAEFVALAIPAIEPARMDMLDALGKGYSALETSWDTSGGQWLPTKLEWRDPRWFQFDHIDGRTLRLRSDSNIYGDPLPAGKFIVSTQAAKSGLPIRGGLARAAAYAFLFFNFVMRDWVTFCELFGIPLRLGRYDAGASAADLDILFSAVRNIGSDAAAILPKGMEIEFPEVTAARGSADLWENLLGYLDRQVSKLILGQTLTSDTGKNGGGSYGLGAIHNEVRIDILRSDAKGIATDLNRDLVKIIVDLNFGPQAVYPKLVIPVEEPEDMKALADHVDKLCRLGQPIGTTWASKKFNIPLPAAGEALLTPGPIAPSPAAPASQAINRAAHSAAPAPAGNAPDTADQLLPPLGTAAAPIVSAWLNDIEAMLAQAASLEEFQAALLARYGNLPGGDLAAVMAEAFNIAQSRGRSEVADGQ